MAPEKLLLVALAAVVAGAMNAVAGGGTLVTYPALVTLGIPPIVANATSTVALWPGLASSFWGYRGELRAMRRWALHWAIPSFIGGGAGALLLLNTPERRFAALVPYLIWSATVLFIVRGPLMKWARGHAGPPADFAERKPPLGGLVFQLFMSVYGGYFGAGGGILMLTAYGLMGMTNLHQMNGLKNWVGIVYNFIAVLIFASSGIIQWSVALTMAIGAIAGGALGSHYAQRLGQVWVQRAIVVVGLGSGLVVFLKGV